MFDESARLCFSTIMDFPVVKSMAGGIIQNEIPLVSF
jgi:hypothetical protein